MDKFEKKLNRRGFIQKGFVAGIGAGLGMPFLRMEAERVRPGRLGIGQKQETSVPEYRILGRTGLRVTTVGYGAMRTRDPAVIHRALDLGLNYIDTSRGYMDGYNEIVVGRVLKTRRQETAIATKITNLGDMNTIQQCIDSVDQSLRALQTDTIDVIQLHNLKSVDAIQNEMFMEALQRIKQSGKARFIGFTTHRNEEALLEAAIDMDFYDVILVKYNFKASERLGLLIRKAADAGIGIVAMKTQAGGYKDHRLGNVSPHQAALRWVLQNHGVATTIPSMTTYGHLEENIKAMGTRLGWSDRTILHRYGQAIDKRYCRMCDGCSGTCEHSVDVLEVNRSLMYMEGYEDPSLAWDTYRRIDNERRPDICTTCSQCTVHCVHNLDIRRSMLRANRIFG